MHAEDPRVVRDHFRRVQTAIVSRNIEANNTYNMEKKGFLLGLAQRSKVICTYEGSGRTFRMPDDGNRKFLTAIESVSVGGRVLPSLFIYKGAYYYIGWHQFTGCDSKSKDFRFSYSPKG